ncbi:MAG TPA: 50S ribosomal protein L10 [Bacteroidetes bacterium]|nr:50S ribosomal protein L10 [Bacteroidota bacterium]
MPTPQKEQIVKEMTDKFGRANGIYLLDFTGLDVNITNELRRNFREANIEYKVVKNTLAKLSFQNAGIEGLNEYLTGVNGYVISYDDPTLPAKILDKNKEVKERVKFKAVLFEGKVFGPEMVEKLSKLPSKEELLGQLVGMLQSPLVKLANTLNTAMINLINVLNALENKKKE